MGQYRELINQDRKRTSLTGFLWECCDLRNSYVNPNKSLSVAKKKYPRKTLPGDQSFQEEDEEF